MPAYSISIDCGFPRCKSRRRDFLDRVSMAHCRAALCQIGTSRGDQSVVRAEQDARGGLSSRLRPRVLQRKHLPILSSKQSRSSGDAGHHQDAGRVPGNTTMNDKTRNRVWKWSLIGLFGVAALALAAGGYWLYRHETQAIRSEKQSELKAIAELKANQIAAWRNERLADARVNSKRARSSRCRWPLAPGFRRCLVENRKSRRTWSCFASPTATRM